MRKGTTDQRRSHPKNKIGGRTGQGLFVKSKQIESRIRTNHCASIAFRPDILNNYNPAEKSGFLFPSSSQFDHYDKRHIISEWNEIFKKHFKPVLVNQSDSLETVLSKLQSETIEISKSKEWRLKIQTPDDYGLLNSELHVYEVIDQVNVAMMPLDWIDQFKLIDVRELMFGIVYKMATAYEVDLIFGDIINAELWNYHTEKDLKNYLIDMHGDGIDTNKMFENYVSYRSGRPAKLSKELRDYKKLSLDYLKQLFEKCKKKHFLKHKYLFTWLKQGLDILSLPIEKVSSFTYNPWGAREDESILMKETIFFPYSVEDELFQESENWLNDRYNNCGAADIYNYTVYTKEGSESSRDYISVLRLIKWMEESHPIRKKSKKLWS